MAAVVGSLVPVASHSSPALDRHQRIVRVPRLVLWAWERPEDLRFLPANVGVAFLAGTVDLREGRADYHPRRQPLRIGPETRLVAVIRIEAEDSQLDSEQVQKTAAAIVRASSLPRVAGLQIDFDATASERGFYSQLLAEVRRKIPPSMPISITALASWCIGDDWIGGLPVDEAVPMLFRLGTGQNEVTSWIGSERDFREPLCRDSLGISLDEPWRALPADRRVYAFSPKPWTENSFAALALEMNSWH